MKFIKGLVDFVMVFRFVASGFKWLEQNQGIHRIQFTIQRVTQEVKTGEITNNLLENRCE